MKNKVKFWGIVILILMTLFCLAFAACSDDEEDIGNGNGIGNGGGGGGGGGGGTTQQVPGNITIAPTTNLKIGDTLIATYDGNASVEYQWNRSNLAIPGATQSTYTITQPGNYNVTISASGYTSKTSNTVTVTDDSGQPAPDVPGLSPSGNISLVESPNINFGTRKYTGTLLGNNGRIPIARHFRVRNNTNTTIYNLTFDLQGSQYFIVEESIPGNQNLNSANVGISVKKDLPPGTSTFYIAVQPNHLLNAGYYYDVLRIYYPADPGDMIPVYLNFILEKGDGQRVPDGGGATHSSNTLNSVAVNTNGDSYMTQYREYAISDVYSETSIPADLVDPNKWVKNGQTLHTNGAVSGALTAGSGTVEFSGLPENKHYWVYTRYAANDNYNAGPIKVERNAPLAVSTFAPGP